MAVAFFAGKCNKDLGQGEGKGKGKLVVNAVAVMNMLIISVMNMDGDIGDILMKTRERSRSVSHMKFEVKMVMSKVWVQDQI